MSDKNTLSRRQILAAASSGIVLSLAGCSSTKEELDIPPKDFEMSIPDDVLGGLELYNRVRQRERPEIKELPEGEIVVTVGSNIYEDVGVRQGLDGAFDLESEMPYRVIGPTYIDVAAGSIITGAVESFRSQVNSQMGKRIDSIVKERLREFEGVDDVKTTVNETLHREYEAEVELPAIDLSEYTPMIEEETMLELDPILFKGGFEMFEVEDSIDYFGVVWVEPEEEYTITIPKEKFPEDVRSQMEEGREVVLNLGEYEKASLEDMISWVESEASSGNRQV